jgi:hypothetical protein
MIRKLAVLLALLFLSVLAGEGLYLAKDGFSSRRIHSLDYQVAENWDEEADRALEQTFRYIGRGRQCFAFASEDGKYVLKFPRTDIYKTPFWARALPVRSYRAQLEENHKKRERFILNSFRLSFDELKDQTALLAVHLGQSASKGKKLLLIDAAGSKHKLPLEKTSFVLQYKQPILMKSFSAALDKGERKEAEKILDALLAAVVERANKGILNRDRSFLRNYGFDGTKAYQIDIGSFFRSEDLDPSTAYHKSVRDSIEPVQEWLADHSPEMLEYLNKQLKTIL